MNKIKYCVLKSSQNKAALIFVSIFVTLAAILLPNVCVHASTSDHLYAKSHIEANRDLYGEKYTPAQKLSSGEIDHSTGEVRVDEVDISLPGKNGLDLNIHRIYGSQEPQYRPKYIKDDYYVEYVTEKAYTYTAMDGSGTQLYVSFEKEEDMVDSFYTTPRALSGNRNEDVFGVEYEEYTSIKSSTGEILLERDKTNGVKRIYLSSRTGMDTVGKKEGNVYINSARSHWKLVMPYVSRTTCISENTRRVYYYRFSNENGEIYDLRFYVTTDDSTPHIVTKFYGSAFSVELAEDSELKSYTLILTDKTGKIYKFNLGTFAEMDSQTVVTDCTVSDRFGNTIIYNGNEITDSYGRKLRITANGIELYNGNNYKYIVKYGISEIYDQDRDPYGKLTIFTKHKLTVSRSTSSLDSPNESFEETIYITQAKETDCSISKYDHVPVYLLREVVHPQGLKVIYDYETKCNEEKTPISSYNGTIKKYYVPRVASRTEYIKTSDDVYTRKNHSSYSYNTYTVSFLFDDKKSVDEFVYIGGVEYKIITRRYDDFGRILRIIESDGTDTKDEEYLYEYSESDNRITSLETLDYPIIRQKPIKVIKTTVNGVLTDAVMTNYTRDRKPTLVQKGLQKTTYTYDDTYGFLIESTQTSDFDRSIKTVGTKTKDGKNIAKTEIFDVVGDAETLQGVTEYTYNADGTMASKTVWQTLNGDTIQTVYTYNYSLFTNLQGGEHSVTSTITTTDASGNIYTETTAIEYDLLGNVIKETFADGTATSYKYDLMRRVTEEFYPDGTKNSIAYSNNYQGSTVSVTRPDGSVLTYQYDPNGNYLSASLDEMLLISNTYDALNRKIKTTSYNDDDTALVERYSYDALDRVTAQTTAGETVNYMFDGTENVFNVKNNSSYISGSTDLNGQYVAALIITNSTTRSSVSWSASVDVIVDDEKVCDVGVFFDTIEYAVIDLRGKNTLEFDGRMNGTICVRLIKLEDLGTGTLGASTVVTATTTGDQSFTPPKIVTTYDGIGKVISEEKRNNITDAVLTRDEYSYDFLGNVKEYRDSRVNLDGVGTFTTQTEYNWQGLPVKETNAVGDAKLYAYDLLGRLVEAQDETGSKTMFTYDQLGREIVAESEITDTETARTEKYYDLSGNVVKERTKNNKAGQSTAYREVCYEYDSMHRPTVIKTNDGTRDIYTQYAYDSMGNVTKVVTGQTQKLDMSGEIPQTANVTLYEYDRFGNVTKTTDANGLFETAEYNYIGLPITTTDKKGGTTAYTYNVYGSRLTASTAGVDTISYTYNVNNMPISVTQGANTTIYEYDALGRLTKETENGIVKTYSMDKLGNLISSNVGGVETAYSYDLLNRLTGVIFDGGSAGYTYDKMGRIIGETKGGIETSYTYNKAGWLTNKTNTKDNATTAYALTYSNDGNIVTRTENGEVTNYTYDNLGQLVAEDNTLYEYDTRGNRTKMTKDGIVTEYRYDRTNKLMTENTNGVWTAYAYDQNGNNTLREVYEITADGMQDELYYLILKYDPLNRLTKVQKDGMTAEYIYGVDNMRKSKTVNGETEKYIWDGANIVGITDNEGVITNRYYRGVGLIASKENDVLSYYQTNDHGDVSAWGGVSYNYDAFGNQKDQSDDGNPFRFCGEYADVESGLIYLRNRYYDPQLGRFINEDPIRDGLNWYVYCENNPVMFVDPTGLHYEDVIADLSTIVSAKARMLSAPRYSTEYRLAYQNAMQAKESISNDVIYIENLDGLRSVLSPIVEGDNNSLESLKGARSSVETALNDYNRGRIIDDIVTTGLLTAGGAVAIKAGVGALAGKIATKVAPAASVGFPTFNKLKEYLGSPGSGNHWHHIVEQCQIVKSGFSEFTIHATNNIYAVNADIHAKITGYYGSIQSFTDGMKVRDWLAGQSFEAQYQFGINVLKQFGVIK